MGRFHDSGRVIDRFTNAIAEPTRLRSCPASILASGQAARRARHGSMYECGARSGLVPMSAVVVSYFLRIGHVTETAVMDVLYRHDPSTIASSGNGPPPRASSGRKR